LMGSLVRDLCFNFENHVVVTWRTKEEAQYQLYSFELFGAKVGNDLFNLKKYRQQNKQHHGLVFDIFKGNMELNLRIPNTLPSNDAESTKDEEESSTGKLVFKLMQL
jgi:hypothetical protein